MPDFLAPVSPQSLQLAPENLQQTINPWTWIFNTTGNQVGMLNLSVNLGNSSAPKQESAAISAASYGKQLGRIEDLLDLLIKDLKLAGKFQTDSDEEKAVNAYRVMRQEISEAIKSA